MQDLDTLMRDKLDIRCREQLSAMLDAELAPDQARFLLRRLQHDKELAGCWERWQLCGDLMRGSTGALLPSDFADRVQFALAEDADAGRLQAQVGSRARSRWVPWAGSAALAASVAAVALLVGRGAPLTEDETPAPERIATVSAQVEAIAQSPAAPSPSTPSEQPSDASTTADLGDLAGAAAATTALAAVTAPTTRRNARGSRETRQRVAVQSTTAAPPAAATQLDASDVLTASVDTDGQGGAGPAPVLTVPVEHPLLAEVQPQARPWPRSVLPGFSSDSAFSADLQTARPSYQAFEPRLPAQNDDTPLEVPSP